MALTFTTTSQASLSQGIKCLVHGRAGAGKTTLITTAPRPILLSAEAGTLSIARHNIPMILIRSMKDLNDAFAWCQGSAEAKNYDTYGLDSVSEIAEILLLAEKQGLKDKRMAYTEMNDQLTVKLRQFRDLPNKHVYFCSKTELKDANGVKIWAPWLPGKSTANNLPYFFDEVFYLGIGETPNPEVGGPPIQYRYLQTQLDNQYDAKDRSGVLDFMEKPDLTHIFNKITASMAPPPMAPPPPPPPLPPIP